VGGTCGTNAGRTVSSSRSLPRSYKIEPENIDVSPVLTIDRQSQVSAVWPS
jgi:hypothetical protein